MTGLDQTSGPQAAAAPRGAARPRGLAAACLLATVTLVNLCWDVGASSLFGDEVASLNVADGPASGLIDRLNGSEIAPPLFYAALAGWVRVVGLDGDGALRLLSVACMVATVVATAELTALVADRWRGWLAGGLVALSPLMLMYGQQVRAYALVAALSTGAVACTVLASRRASVRWMVGAGGLLVAALWTHHTAALVALAVTVFVVTAEGLPIQRRLTFAAVVGVAWLLTMPLAAEQLGRGDLEHPSARLSLTTLWQVVGAPFDGRVAVNRPIAGLGALAVGVLLIASVAAARRRGRELGLIAAAATLPIAVVTAGGLVGMDVMWSRYVVLAVPFVCCLAAAAPARTRLAVAVAVVFATLMLPNAIRQRLDGGHYVDTRAAVRTADVGWREGDALMLTTDVATNWSIEHYAKRFGIPEDRVIAPTPEALRSAGRAGARVWIASAPASLAAMRRGLAPAYRPTRAWRFDDGPVLQLTLTVPTQ